MTPVDATTGRRLDREAIIAIAGMYADRLRLDPFNDGACDPDMQISRAAIGAATPANVDVVWPQFMLHDALLCGIDVALAVIADPIGDPSKALREAFNRFAEEVKLDADTVRRDAQNDEKERRRLEAIAAL